MPDTFTRLDCIPVLDAYEAELAFLGEHRDGDVRQDAASLKLATFEWHCTACNTTSWVSGSGGLLENHAEGCLSDDGHAMHIHIMLGGQRVYAGTAAAIEGRKPGEKSRSLEHRENCTDPNCEDWAHPRNHPKSWKRAAA